MPPSGFAIFLNGAYGVGKSATLDHLGDLLAAAGRPLSLMDVDWFHRSWPVADHAPDNVLLEARNIAAVWQGHQLAVPRQLVMSGVIETEADRDRYEAAVDRRTRAVRLSAAPDVLRQRLRGRCTESQDSSLRWHLDRCTQLAARLDAADLDELVVDTGALGPPAVAARTLRHFGLLD